VGDGDRQADGAATRRAEVRAEKKYFDRVQEILAKSADDFFGQPDILAGAKNSLGNFHPAVLEPYVSGTSSNCTSEMLSRTRADESALTKAQSNPRKAWDDTRLVKSVSRETKKRGPC